MKPKSPPPSPTPLAQSRANNGLFRIKVGNGGHFLKRQFRVDLIRHDDVIVFLQLLGQGLCVDWMGTGGVVWGVQDYHFVAVLDGWADAPDVLRRYLPVVFVGCWDDVQIVAAQ